MAKSEAYNMDCMEALKKFPDKYFDLAVVDPPYGDGVAERERERERAGTGSVSDSTGTRFRIDHLPRSCRERERERREREVISSADCGRWTVSRTGGTWAEKFGKKSLSGTQPRSNRTLTNCSVSHATRLSGGAITSNFP